MVVRADALPEEAVEPAVIQVGGEVAEVVGAAAVDVGVVDVQVVAAGAGSRAQAGDRPAVPAGNPFAPGKVPK